MADQESGLLVTPPLHMCWVNQILTPGVPKGAEESAIPQYNAGGKIQKDWAQNNVDYQNLFKAKNLKVYEVMGESGFVIRGGQRVLKIRDYGDRDGDEMGGHYAGYRVISAKKNSKYRNKDGELVDAPRPKVFDKDMKELTDDEIREKIYPGCICRMVVNPYAYTKGSRGVSFWLTSIQLIDAGKRIESQSVGNLADSEEVKGLMSKATPLPPELPESEIAALEDNSEDGETNIDENIKPLSKEDVENMKW